MPELVFTAYWESASGTPLTSPGTAPQIRVRRLDTNALVVTDQDMTEVGDGLYKYVYAAAVNSIEYAARADGDPDDNGQSTQRYQAGSGDTKVEETWKTLGLDSGDAVTVTPQGVDSASGDVDVDFTGDGITTTTMTRQA